MNRWTAALQGTSSLLLWVFKILFIPIFFHSAHSSWGSLLVGPAAQRLPFSRSYQQEPPPPRWLSVCASTEVKQPMWSLGPSPSYPNRVSNSATSLKPTSRRSGDWQGLINCVYCQFPIHCMYLQFSITSEVQAVGKRRWAERQTERLEQRCLGKDNQMAEGEKCALINGNKLSL